MTKDEAIAFLRKHQPLPSDAEITQEQIDTFDEVRKYFTANPDPECIPLMLNAFGDGSGFGVYQVCDDVFRHFDQSQLTPHLSDALQSPHISVRNWAAEFAVQFGADELVGPLIRYLDSPIDAEGHFFALSALGFIWRESQNHEVLRYFVSRKQMETNSDLIVILNEVLEEATSQS